MSGWRGPVSAILIAVFTVAGVVLSAVFTAVVDAWSVGAIVIASVVLVIAVSTARTAIVRPKRLLSTLRTKEELVALAAASIGEGQIDERSAELLRRISEFTDRTAAEVLTPRNFITALPADSTGSDLIELSARTGFSRVVLSGADLDDIVGQVHIKSLLNLPREQRETVVLSEIMSDVVVVPASIELPDLLAEMRAKGTSLAVVLDEYGGTSGIVTVEDVVEEIVGEIHDEHDRAAQRSAVRVSGSAIVSGRLSLSEVRDAIGVELPEGEYETIGGWIMDRLGAIPQVGATAEVDGTRFEVVEMDNKRVASLRVTETAPVPESASETSNRQMGDR